MGEKASNSKVGNWEGRLPLKTINKSHPHLIAVKFLTIFSHVVIIK